MSAFPPFSEKHFHLLECFVAPTEQYSCETFFIILALFSKFAQLLLIVGQEIKSPEYISSQNYYLGAPTTKPENKAYSLLSLILFLYRDGKKIN